VPRAGALPTPAEQALAAKDKTLTSPAAIELARHALEEVTDPITVGEYVAAAPDAERLVTHLFDCTLSGYRGWRWAVTLSRVPRGRTATVCEMALLPGEEALLAPAWVPWAERLEPGDITRSDRLPRKETDERLEPGWEATGEDADAVALDELDLGRPRVLSAQGVASAAMDISDGLAGDLGHLLTASGRRQGLSLGAELWEDRLPLDPVLRESGVAHDEALQLALHGGDDYELLFTAPTAQTDTILQCWPDARMIGRIVAESAMLLVDAKGQSRPLAARGHDHFST